MLQNRRTLKGHHSSGPKHQIFTRLRVPAFSRFLFFDTKLAKPTGKHIFPGLKPFLDDFQKGFHCFGRFGLVQFALPYDAIDQCLLGETHRVGPPFLEGVLFTQNEVLRGFE
jgi:hypothetical protein